MHTQAEKDRWRRIHNRKPGEPKDCMSFYELRSAAEVATILGVSKQRVQQLERSALYKIRRSLKQFWADYNA